MHKARYQTYAFDGRNDFLDVVDCPGHPKNRMLSQFMRANITFYSRFCTKSSLDEINYHKMARSVQYKHHILNYLERQQPDGN